MVVYELIEALLSDLRFDTVEMMGIGGPNSWSLNQARSTGLWGYMLRAGAASFTVEGQKEFDLSVGDVVVVPAGAEHGIRSIGSPAAELTYAHYSYDVRRAAALIRLLPKAFRISADGAAMPDFMVSITAMLEEAIDRGQQGSVVTKRLAEVSAILACQHHMRTQLSLPDGSARSQGIVKVGPAVLAMLDHPEAPWTVTELAKRAGMSRGSFAATFKESLGESPHAYLLRLRMGLAAHLLRNRSTLIAMVAEKVGYATDVAFYRAFRRHFGQSPGAFRLAQSGSPGPDGAAGQAESAAASVRNPGT